LNSIYDIETCHREGVLFGDDRGDLPLKSREENIWRLPHSAHYTRFVRNDSFFEY